MSKILKIIIVALLLLQGATPTFGWGQKGHDVVCHIAQSHLKPSTKRKVKRLLDSHSLVYYSNWMDNASHSKEYSYSKTWHYANIDEGKTLETMPRERKGDILTALNALSDSLRGGGTKEQEALWLKMLIHLVGDLHCPMHAGHLSDLGGNTIRVSFFDKERNLHSVWDTDLVEAAHKWSYTEWAENIDIKTRMTSKSFVEGDYEEWFMETHQLCCYIYNRCREGCRLSYDEVAHFSPIIEEQLLRAGLRLAYILNEIM